MKFQETAIDGAFAIDLEPWRDERGFFSRAWCQREFLARSLKDRIVQVNVSGNVAKGTLRGLHYQAPPNQEVKIVSCHRGAIYDVAVDLRPASSTYLKWAAVELTAENRRRFYIPEGCAHGFQTLTDDTEVLYLMSAFYSAEHARGRRFDDPAIGVDWPLAVTTISAADRSWPLLSCEQSETQS